MKILMLTPYLPFPLLSGGQIRTYNLLKKLADKHEVTLFALIKNEEEKKFIPELQKYCARVEVFKRSQKPFTLKNIFFTALSTYPFLVVRNHAREVIQAVKQELENTAYDLIHAETFYMMPHIPPTDIPIILVEQTIEYLGYESYAKKVSPFIKPLLNIDIAKIKRWETYYWNHCDTLIVMSNQDKAYIRDNVKNPDKIAVVENGVDTAWFEQKIRTEPPEPTILSVGTFKWLPNREAVTFLVESVWPLIKSSFAQAKLWIVGNAPTDKILNYAANDPQITVTGKIADIRDAFANAHVLVAPVFSGKGTRYKVLEAMAAGTPVIATPTAVEGLNVQDGVQVLIGRTKSEIAQATINLLQDPKKRKALAKEGKNFVKKHYDWSLISKKLDTIYQRIGQHGKKN